ncbi:hypothetical protein P692DRAFT_20880794 [Suillus brevipes Sb2]|nr:hypothetical protein P692DRAFT_20880794 [Suillus brevipes Sb2]
MACPPGFISKYMATIKGLWKDGGRDVAAAAPLMPSSNTFITSSRENPADGPSRGIYLPACDTLPPIPIPIPIPSELQVFISDISEPDTTSSSTRPPIIQTPTPMPDPPAPTVVDPDVIVPDNDEVGFPHVIVNLIIVEVAALSLSPTITPTSHPQVMLPVNRFEKWAKNTPTLSSNAVHSSTASSSGGEKSSTKHRKATYNTDLTPTPSPLR